MMLNIDARRFLFRWKYWAALIIPLAFLPIPLQIDTKEARCGYAVIVIALFWVTEVIPLAVTSLLPIVFFPLLGILSSDDVCKNYMKETNMMLLCGIVAAIAIENCNLHRRIALGTLLCLGGSTRWILFGCMFTTAFLSMWISNTAASALMVPIIESILDGIYVPKEEEDTPPKNVFYLNPQMQDSQVSLAKSVVRSQEDLVNGDVEATRVPSHYQLEKEKSNMRKCLLLSVAYGANLGGTGTITGTGPNLVLMENLSNLYGSNHGMNYGKWMLYNVPGMLLAIILAWIWLQISFQGIKKFFKPDNSKSSEVKKIIRKQYDELQTMGYQEIVVLTLFIILIALWVFRDPEFIDGWKSIFPAVKVKDSVAGVTIIALFFLIPSQPDFFWTNLNDESKNRPPSPILNWKIVQDKIPWGILLLMGGGFAMADATKASGLSTWMGEQLSYMRTLQPLAIVAVISIITAMLTEVASNTATATILIPVLANMSKALQIHPLYLMLPATISCSFAFMLPIATPPNAIVFEASKMTNAEMAKLGAVMNIVCVLVTILMINTLGIYMFDLNTFPEWAGDSQNITLGT